jgi:hypothetical protein
LHDEVVAARGLCRQPETREGRDDDPAVSVLVVVVHRGQKGEVGVAEVLVDRPATTGSTGEMYPLACLGFGAWGLASVPGRLPRHHWIDGRDVPPRLF